MAKSDLFKRTVEAGTSFLDMSRERAEAVVKEWVEAGDLRKGKAQQAIDDVLARSRKVSEELRDLIRREIREQLGGMGVATADDIARLEAKIDELKPAPAPPPAPAVKQAKKAAKAAKAAKAPSGRKGAPIGKSGTTGPSTRARKGAAAKPAARPAATPAGADDGA
jgi:polyhydroxyalkanoate synthesis regulator phasin